jgi:hypothetical protein
VLPVERQIPIVYHLIGCNENRAFVYLFGFDLLIFKKNLCTCVCRGHWSGAPLPSLGCLSRVRLVSHKELERSCHLFPGSVCMELVFFSSCGAIWAWSFLCGKVNYKFSFNTQRTLCIIYFFGRALCISRNCFTA